MVKDPTGVQHESGGAHASPNLQTGIPSFFALWTRLSWMPMREEDQHADLQHFGHLIVALGGRGVTVLHPVGRETGLRHAAVVGSARGDLLGTLRRFAVHQHHVRMLGVDLVELRPDQPVIVEFENAVLGPGGRSTCCSARFLAARKSRLSVIAEVRLRWLTFEPLRGSQCLPA